MAADSLGGERMSREDIITMAREAHGAITDQWFYMDVAALTRFAALALAKDGDGRTVQAVQAEARAEEREACRKECADLLALSARQARDGDPFEIGREAGHSECEAAIRARNEP